MGRLLCLGLVVLSACVGRSAHDRDQEPCEGPVCSCEEAIDAMPGWAACSTEDAIIGCRRWRAQGTGETPCCGLSGTEFGGACVYGNGSCERVIEYCEE